jgi:hypothetical protein
MIGGDMKTATKAQNAAPSTGRAEGTVKLERELIQQAKVVAAMSNKSLTQVLAELLRPPLEQAFQTTIKGIK